MSTSFTAARPELNRLSQSDFRGRLDLLSFILKARLTKFGNISDVLAFEQIALDLSFYVFFARVSEAESASSVMSCEIDKEIGRALQDVFCDIEAKLLFNVFIESKERIDQEFGGSLNRYLRSR